MAPRAPLAAALAAVALSACSQTVHNSEPERARGAVAAFLADCGLGKWLTASSVLAEDARSYYVEHSDKAVRCAEELGFDAQALRTAIGQGAQGDVGTDELRKAFRDARIGPVRIRGDQAEVDVSAAGVQATTLLEDTGEVYRIDTK